MGFNEAGSTHMTDPIEVKTTEPWAPEPIDVSKVSLSCYSHRCFFHWTAPENNGAPIDNYTVFVSQPNAIGDDAFVRRLQQL